MNGYDFKISAGLCSTYYFFLDEMRVKTSEKEWWDIKIDDNMVLYWKDKDDEDGWIECGEFVRAYREYIEKTSEQILLGTI